MELQFIGTAYLALVTDTPDRATGIGIANGANALPRVVIPAGKAARLDKAIDYLQKGLVTGKEMHTPNVCRSVIKTWQ